MTAAEVIAAALAGQTGTAEWNDVPIIIDNPKPTINGTLGTPRREMFAPGFSIDLAYLRSRIAGTSARPWTPEDAK